MRNVAVVGATADIGVQALRVIRSHLDGCPHTPKYSEKYLLMASLASLKASMTWSSVP